LIVNLGIVRKLKLKYACIGGKCAMRREIVELKGHIIDSMILPRVLDTIMDMKGDFEILEIRVGKTKMDESYCKMVVEGDDRLFEELEKLGVILPKKEVKVVPAPADKVLPNGFYATTHHTTYVYLNGRWRKVKNIGNGLCHCYRKWRTCL